MIGSPRVRRLIRLVGVIAGVLMISVAVLGLAVSSPDQFQHDAVRMLYLHVPTVMSAYLAFVTVAIGSVAIVMRRGLIWDHLAGASAEVGVVMMGITLMTGMIWGRITWGVYWQWDARMTSTAIIFVTYVGYLAVRRLGGSPAQRASRSAVVGIVAVAEIPLVHWSVIMWRSLHQDPTVLTPTGDGQIDGSMLAILAVAVAAFVLTTVWLVAQRAITLALDDQIDQIRVDAAITARHAEGDRWWR
ncbi:MAG: cytochrome C biogenesis protein [Ilumatobacter coccineus]|uniref:Heme exporter protein C n=1 Tax=Ilumatobacter coccineus TaxID=467094 RepID=A0A2G6K6X9_9ACTN|nr:MAG: cytochrome C biogenesis protein [Ilumatobacter coccineus]